METLEARKNIALVYKFMTDTRETKLFTRSAAAHKWGKDKQLVPLASLSSTPEQTHGNNHLQWEQLRAGISYQTVSDPSPSIEAFKSRHESSTVITSDELMANSDMNMVI